METNWKPTEEELLALEWELHEWTIWFLYHNRWMKIKTFDSPERFVFQVRSNHGENACNVYPKSIEELRSLIDMMRP